MVMAHFTYMSLSSHGHSGRRKGEESMLKVAYAREHASYFFYQGIIEAPQ